MQTPGPRFIIQKTNELLGIAHLHMRIVKIQRVGQSARIHSILSFFVYSVQLSLEG